MTKFFMYDILTWPEVAALRRDTPLLLPLGDGYPHARLAEALGDPPEAGLLPAFPFGWTGSGLEVHQDLLGAYLSNLLDSLRDDGFTRVYALTPPGIDLGLGAARIALAPQADGASARRSSRSLPAEEERGKVVILPIGHTEQHGFHLPLSTDTLIIDAIAGGIVESVQTQAARLPVMPYGVSTHRACFAGTLNAGGRAFEDFWLGVIDTLVQRGFERFYLLSGHGGNCSFLVNTVKYAGERFPGIFCATAWLYLSGPEGVAALQENRRSATGGMGHAGELETSLILHLHPDLTHMERVVDETDYISTPSYYMDWVEGGALIANPPWTDDTTTGAYGAGSLASAEHGKLWLDAAVREKVGHVGEIHAQFERRAEKRNLLR